MLAEEGFVQLVDGQWQWTQESYPADAVSLRSVTLRQLRGRRSHARRAVIGETDFTSGPSTLHEKAIYIVEGQLYQVERFDFDNRKAFVREVECDYYTDAITYTKVTILDTFADGSSVEGPPPDDVAALAAGIDIDTDQALGTRHSALDQRSFDVAPCPVPGACSRRSPRRLARRRLQEDQVLHERERRVGRAGSARTADAHDVLLDDRCRLS